MRSISEQSLKAPTAKDKRLIFVAVSCASFLATYTGSSLNVALPSIGRELGMDHARLQYIVSSYLMMNAVLLVPLGRLADLCGRRLLFNLGMALFLVSHAVCAAAPNGWILIAARGAGGAAAALFFSNTMAILSSVFGIAERGKILGLNVSITYVGLTVGPFLGGVLTSWWGWRSVFLSVIPIALVGLFVAWRKLPCDHRPGAGGDFSLLAMGHYAAMLILVILGLSALPSAKGVLMVSCGALLGFFFFRPGGASTLLLDLPRLGRNRIFVLSNLASFIQYVTAFATGFLLSLFLQNEETHNLSPHAAGMILLTQPLMQALFSPLAGLLSDRLEARWLATAGMAVTSLGLFLFSLVSPSSPLVLIVLILLMQGVGFAFFTSPNNNLIMSSVSERDFGIASGVLATGRTLGMSVSLAAAAVVFKVYEGIFPQPGAFLHSFRTIFLVFFLLSLAGVASSAVRAGVRR